MQSAANSSEILGPAATGPAEVAADQNIAAYLQCLLTLSLEMASATEAIASNRPAELLQSTRRQESLARELVGLRASIKTARGQLNSAISPARLIEMEWAERSLADAAARFSALLQRTAKSIALLARLHGSYISAYPGADQSDRLKATWSCEG